MTDRPTDRPDAAAKAATSKRACRLLALDTATEQLVAGLVTPQGRWLRHEAGGALASARLLPLLLELLQQGGQTLGGLDAIAFGVGPGAFTGLRTACAVAQGLGFGAGRPLLAIDSLLIVAEAARARASGDGAGRWWVAVDARMDEVYAAEYSQGDGGWQVVTAPALYTLAALAARWADAAPQRVAGNAPRVFGQRLPVHGARCVDASEGADPAADRAAALLTLAEAAWAAGLALPADQALPLYLRDKVALTTDERERQRAAAASEGAR